MDQTRAKEMIKKLLAEIQDGFGSVAVDRYASLRDVDAKVREFKLLLGGVVLYIYERSFKNCGKSGCFLSIDKCVYLCQNVTRSGKIRQSRYKLNFPEATGRMGFEPMKDTGRASLLDSHPSAFSHFATSPRPFLE